MKKVFIMLVCSLIMGCSANDINNKTITTNTNSIKPVEFSSNEAKELFQLYENEMAIFDITTDDTVKSFTVSIWLNTDGEWQLVRNSYGEIENLGNKFAIRYIDTTLKLYSIFDSGFNTLTYSHINTNFKDVSERLLSKLNYEKTIELNEEIPLFTYIGGEKLYFDTSKVDNDFKNIECETGLVVTITFSDEKHYEIVG